MAKPKRDEYVVNVSFRLFGNDGRRWDEMYKRAHRVDEGANKTDVARSLLGLPPDKPTKPLLLTDADRAYFSDPNATSELPFFRHYLALSHSKRAAIKEAVGMLKAVPEPLDGRNGFVVRIEEARKKRAS